MKDIKITFNPTEIKSLHFQNTFKQKAGQNIKLAVQTKLNIKTNPAAPTTAMIFVQVSASDEEKNLSFEIETITMAAAETFIDNIDEVIKTHFLPSVMLAVNEKVRNATSVFGLNLRLPSPQLVYTKEDENGSTLYYN